MAAKNVDYREGQEIIFADGEKRRIRPLTIRQMRKFMKVVQNLGDIEGSSMDDGQIDLMMEAIAIALEKDYPEIAADRDALEDVVDMKSFNGIMAAAMGTDPNE